METHVVTARELLVDAIDFLLQFKVVSKTHTEGSSGDEKDALVTSHLERLANSHRKSLTAKTIYGWNKFDGLKRHYAMFDQILRFL